MAVCEGDPSGWYELVISKFGWLWGRRSVNRLTSLTQINRAVADQTVSRFRLDRCRAFPAMLSQKLVADFEDLSEVIER